MKGFKNSTKTVYLTGKSPGPKGAAKAAQTMKSFKTGAPSKKFAEGGSVKKSSEYEDGYKAGKDFYDNNYAKSLTPSEKGGTVGKVGRALVRGVAVKGLMDPMESAATKAGVATTNEGRKVTGDYLKGQRAARKDTVGYAKGGRVMVRSRDPMIKC